MFFAQSNRYIEFVREAGGLEPGAFRQAKFDEQMGDQAGSMAERSEFCQTPHLLVKLGESGKAGPPPFAWL
ncbi:MAG: hypothetical protein AB8C46_06200 [Burkholderiaceae bacterium]